MIGLSIRNHERKVRDGLEVFRVVCRELFVHVDRRGGDERVDDADPVGMTMFLVERSGEFGYPFIDLCNRRAQRVKLPFQQRNVSPGRRAMDEFQHGHPTDDQRARSQEEGFRIRISA